MMAAKRQRRASMWPTGVAVVRLDRPREHNRLEPADLAVLRETFDVVDANFSTCARVATGTGKSFSSDFPIGVLADRLPAN